MNCLENNSSLTQTHSKNSNPLTISSSQPPSTTSKSDPLHSFTDSETVNDPAASLHHQTNSVNTFVEHLNLYHQLRSLSTMLGLSSHQPNSTIGEKEGLNSTLYEEPLSNTQPIKMNHSSTTKMNSTTTSPPTSSTPTSALPIDIPNRSKYGSSSSRIHRNSMSGLTDSSFLEEELVPSLASSSSVSSSFLSSVHSIPSLRSYTTPSVSNTTPFNFGKTFSYIFGGNRSTTLVPTSTIPSSAPAPEPSQAKPLLVRDKNNKVMDYQKKRNSIIPVTTTTPASKSDDLTSTKNTLSHHQRTKSHGSQDDKKKTNYSYYPHSGMGIFFT